MLRKTYVVTVHFAFTSNFTYCHIFSLYLYYFLDFHYYNLKPLSLQTSDTYSCATLPSANFNQCNNGTLARHAAHRIAADLIAPILRTDIAAVEVQAVGA